MTSTNARPLPGHPHQLPVPVVQRAHGHHDGDLAGRRVRARRPARPGCGPRAVSVGAPRRGGPGQDVQQRRGVLRAQPTGRDRPVRGAPGQSQVRRDGVGRHPVEVLADRAGVAPGDRPGQGRVAEPQRVVQRRRQQRRQHPAGLADASRPQQVGGLVDQRDQVVRAVRQGRVIERPGVLGDPLGHPAEVGDQPGGEHPVRRGDPPGDARQPVQVGVRAGEGHRRMQGHAVHIAQHGQAVRPRGVRDHLTGPQRAGAGQAGDHAGQRVVRHGEQQQVVGGPGDLVGRAGSRPAAAGGRPGRGRRRRRPRRRRRRCPAASSAAPSTAPTRPAPTTPTIRGDACAGTSSAYALMLQIQSSRTAVPVDGQYAAASVTRRVTSARCRGDRRGPRG